MNHSELSNFTHAAISTLLRKGQNWEQNWDGFGWGRHKVCYRAFKFGPFLRFHLSSGCPQPAPPNFSQTPSQGGLSKRWDRYRLSFPLAAVFSKPSQKITQNRRNFSKTASKRLSNHPACHQKGNKKRAPGDSNESLGTLKFYSKTAINAAPQGTKLGAKLGWFWVGEGQQV